MRAPSFRVLSLVVLFGFAGAAVTASVVTRNVVRKQQELVLRERAAEVATVLGATFTGLEPSLESLGTIARLEPEHPQQFVDAAQALKTDGSYMVVTQRAAGWLVTATAGHDPGIGEVISGARQQLAQRALAGHGLVSGFVRDAGQLRLAIAIPGAAGPGTVVFEESAISPTTPAASTPSGPFRSLDIALYLTSRPDASTLIATTAKHLPLTGVTVNQPLKVGTETWLIVARSNTSLVGSLTSSLPWIILTLGLLAALMMTAIVETLSRRETYASALVAKRTASLETAMTELEESNAQLLRQERLAAMGRLASSVGHELRNPLAVLMNVLYLIEAGAPEGTNEVLHRHLATAKREVSAATLIISDLLDYATARGPIAAPVEISELVVESLSVAPPPDGIEVVLLDQSETPLVVDADRDQIRQVLLNLISNAYDAMPDGGVLTIATARLAEAAQISVSDTGVGMDRQTRDGLFAPFFSKKAKGIGLGLAVCKRIVESHHGTIAVESTPSAGTSFTLTLPHMVVMAGLPA
jgi:signal transduction histidine kinase